jgi:hypothetical protein
MSSDHFPSLASALPVLVACVWAPVQAAETEMKPPDPSAGLDARPGVQAPAPPDKALSFAETYEAHPPTPALPYPEAADLKPVPEPDPLIFLDGREVKTRKDWEKRKQEIRDLAHHYIWGFPPPEKLLEGTPPPEVTKEEDALDGAAVKRTVRIHLAPDTQEPENSMWLYLFLPKNGAGPFPAVLGFDLKHIPYIVKRGYAAATFNPQSGHGMYRYYFAEHSGPWVDHTDARFANLKDQKGWKKFGKRPLHAWGERCIWGWRMRRIMDGLVAQKDIDPKRVIFVGGSRGGQSVVLAAVLDERAAMVFCWQGMVQIRKQIWTDRPEWHCLACMPFAYNNQFDCLPIDMHCLAATLAPRPFVMTYNADPDRNNYDWFTSVKHAYPYLSKVYRFHGLEVQPRNMETWEHKSSPPEAGPLGVHVRPGGHTWLEEDFRYMLDFANYHLKKKVP